MDRTSRLLAQLGGFVSNEAMGADSPSLQVGRILASQGHTLSGYRWLRVTLECGYDTVAWVCGLLAAAWMTRDLAGILVTPFSLVRDITVIGLLSAAAGLLAGLYRGRYQRGSLDEVMGVTIAACVMALFLTVSSPRLISGQHAALQAVAGSRMFACSPCSGPGTPVRGPPARSRAAAAGGGRHRLRRRRGGLDSGPAAEARAALRLPPGRHPRR